MSQKRPIKKYHVRRRTAFKVIPRPRKLRAVATWGPPTLEEQLQNVDDPTASDGEDCEIHYYEERFDTQGERVCLRVGTKSAIEFEKPKSHRACLVRTRVYDSDRELIHTRLEIQSRYVHKALQEVIGPYLGLDFDIPTITIYHPLEPLFHYRRELQEYSNKCNDSKTQSHLGLCLRYVKYTLSREISLFDQVFANESSNLEIDYENLWIAYKPGDLIYKKVGKTDTVSRLRRFGVGGGKQPRWRVLTETIEYDGTDFGHVDSETFIGEYHGRVCIRDLEAFPLHFHPRKAQIQDALVQRGQRYVSLQGACHRFFNGIARFTTLPPICFQEISVRHRVMIDTVAYHNNAVGYRNIIPNDTAAYCFNTVAYRNNTSTARTLGNFNPDARIFRTASKDHLKMREEDFMICSHEVYGYDLAMKMWGVFSVANVRDIEFNSNAFSHLLLSPDKKQLISSLVMQHSNEIDTFDDYIQGKGKGLIFLLHGPPGVGKTFTAESIADHTRKPLFTIDSKDMMSNLSILFSLASSWDAVVLIDEADVFMQERDLIGSYRNDRVSTLLRVLEYFEGIMFLTTNRVNTIDSAFQSRIHLSIAYPPLSHDDRQELWRNWITRENSNSEPDWLTAAFVNKLADRDLNGREIRNVMRIAHALASGEKRPMHAADVFRGLDAAEEFKIGFQDDLAQRKAKVLN
ncbi:P-loop containing nucleoside triphosphate hydrolase protein [Nemania abortiva]|nr:P-loop containing nucleoside triphosphate hydrolase protein [Nemania abortiva]